MTISRHLALGAALLALPAAALVLTGTAAGATVAPRLAAPSSVTHPRAAAVGRLAPSGCAPAAGGVACDLWAKAGSVQLLGQPLPVWGFSSTDADGPGLPGPTLVVDQGDTVTVTLHNQLPQPVSLAFPGQSPATLGEGLSGGDDTTGIGQGATRTYTFRAGHAGTFLYEAGHTPDGARQVAMGLAGALVVRPAGTPSYDDEAVVVLSDVDPALNADPTHFDLRGFHPRLRLLNGKAFPETQPISTDQGHTVLLRYVNAGSAVHAMSLLGASQVETAGDGHPRAAAQREVVAEVDSGATLDTLVTMPTGPEAKVTLYEAGDHLDNDGRTELDPTRVAAGGMMTFLDTAAPPPSDDGVGPVATHVTAAPSPSDARTPVSVSADLSDVRQGGSTVTAAELVLDDPTVAVGSGLPMTGAFGAVTGAVTGTIPVAPPTGVGCDPVTQLPVTLTCLAAGKHVVYVRARDVVGNWGVVGSTVLNLPKTGPATTGGVATPSPTNGTVAIKVSATGDDSAADGTITAGEYFVDTLGDPGAGRPTTNNRVATVVSETATLPATLPSGQSCTTSLAASCLAEGQHHVWFRSKDSLGLWGPVLDIPVEVDRTGPTVLGASVSPSYTNGLVGATGYPGYLKVSAQISDALGRLTAARAYFNGGSQPFALTPEDGKYDSPTENVYGLIPLSAVRSLPDGAKPVLVQGKDDAGNWTSPPFGTSVNVDRNAPTLSGASVSPNPSRGLATVSLTASVSSEPFGLQAAEYWTGTTAPAAGSGTPVQAPAVVGGKVTVAIPTAGLAPGTRQLNLRVRDMAGNWSNVASGTVTIQANALFSSAFDNATSPFGWSSATGGPTVSTAAGIPAGGTNKGLLAAVGGSVLGTGQGTSYVTDNTPAAESTYHARFGFNPGSLATGPLAATWATVLGGYTGDNGGGAQLFTVEYQRTTASGDGRLRVHVGSNVSTPVTVTGLAHTVQVDWATGGTLALGVDGGPAGSVAASASTVGSVRLGLVAAPNYAGAPARSAWFDTFVSVRSSF